MESTKMEIIILETKLPAQDTPRPAADQIGRAHV